MLSLRTDPTWDALTPAGGVPPGRGSPTAIYDPVRDRMLLFGGSNGLNGAIHNDVWALSLTGSPTWTMLAPGGTPPSPRSGHTAIYDPVRDRMVVFGGGGLTVKLNDVWALSLVGSPTWTNLAPSGILPAARSGATAIYDPVRDRMVVFGGRSSASLNDLWALSLGPAPAWTQLFPSGAAPVPRSLHTTIYDPVRDRMVLFGGELGTNPLNDVWALTLSGGTAWSQLVPTGTLPPTLDGHTAIYDPVRDRMVVFGGTSASNVSPEDVWTLSLATPAWSHPLPTVGPAFGPTGHAAIYDPARDRMIVFGGICRGPIYHDQVLALSWGATASVPTSGSGRLRLETPRPNPSRGETMIEFELVEPAPVVLDVFDANGRRVKQVAAADLPAGRHAIPWRGDDNHGRALGSGVYFLHMQSGAFLATRRIVLLR